MTGSNRLLLGFGWSAVVLIGLAVARKRTGATVRELTLDSPYRVELGFLAIASVVAFVVPLTGRIPPRRIARPRGADSAGTARGAVRREPSSSMRCAVSR